MSSLLPGRPSDVSSPTLQPADLRRIVQAIDEAAESEAAMGSGSAMRDEYDHIVIGGGASGCVAAARLVTDGDRRVLLLEAGYSHHHPLLDMRPASSS